MPAKRRVKKPRAPRASLQWRRFAYVFLGLVFSFGLGIAVGIRQGWVEGQHKMGHGASIFLAAN